MTTTRGLSSFGFRTRCRGIGERGLAIAQGFGEAPALLLFLVYADVLCVPQGASAEAFGPLRHGLTCGFMARARKPSGHCAMDSLVVSLRPNTRSSALRTSPQWRGSGVIPASFPSSDHVISAP